MAEVDKPSPKAPVSWQGARAGAKRRTDPATDPPPEKRKYEYDYTSSGVLPVLPDCGEGVDAIGALTLLEVVEDKYGQQLDRCLVIDCRPRSQFHKGHIKGALNVTSWHELDLLMSAEIESDDRVPERHAYVFLSQHGHSHDIQCLRYVRDTDRDLNMEEFPFLYFPNLYVLHGGYEAYLAARRQAVRGSAAAGEGLAKLKPESKGLESDLIAEENRVD